MHFKPAKWKLIVTIVAAVLWWLYQNAILPMCDCLVLEESCTGWPLVMPFSGCYCGCVSFTEALLNLLLFLVVPVVVYLVWSLIQNE